jgi:tetratricopeptide (TPR) repeat protein
MRRSPEEGITNDLPRDICVRESQKALLGGAIARLGNSYGIELKASNCQTGATLAREQAEAADKEHVLPALAKAAQGMRAKLGESLASIESVSPSANWQWKCHHTFCRSPSRFLCGCPVLRRGPTAEAVSTLQRATELDPNLAFAWFWLAKEYYASGGRKQYQEYFDRAWALHDRVSAYERLWITSQRDGQTTGQYIESLETWTRIYPRDTMPPYMLGVLYRTMGEFEKSLAEFR